SEEGVTRSIGLWHQRNRWAEGGYQRYLDYWRLIIRNRMGFRKTVDLLSYWLIQYILPTAAVPDFLMSIARSRLPMLSPLTSLGFSLFLYGMFTGLRRIQTGEPREPAVAGMTALPTVPPIWVTLLQTMRGTIYMLHWLVVMPATTARMSVRQKRLKWVKTVHHGADEMWLDVGEPRSPKF
ncbi:MAG: glycosyltransferase family 2 protein, partial [Microcoleus sp. SIO2G3]|nr:glycosyltransferase family 2 protein [Microcoleus sp. SIO2G3]